MQLQKSLGHISDLMAWFVQKIKSENAAGLLDINRLSEDVLIELLAEVYSYSKLKNLNDKGENYPGIDLGDDVARVAFQITSDASSRKVTSTLRRCIKYKHYKKYTHLIIYVITEKQKSYSGKEWGAILRRKVKFEKKEDIRDYSDLLEAIRHLPIKKIQKVESILEQYFETQSVPVNELLTSHLTRQLEKERQSKKYIPDIFVEVATVKDQARYFADPVFFLPKVLEEVARLDFNDVNRILSKLGLPSFQPDWPDGSSPRVTINEIYERVRYLQEAIQKVSEEIFPYSYPWRTSTPPNTTNIPPHKRYMFEDMQNNLGGSVSSVLWDIDDLIKDLQLMSSRVLFIISRAGQGKTNFVCNFAETVLAKRSVPCIFFAGRDFNYVSPEHIGEYFVKSVFGGRVAGLDAALDLLSEFGAQSDKPVIIIIDGINEHRDIRAFAHHLEKFVEKVLEYKHVKLLLTCRSEYFEDRFSNFKRASFMGEIQFVENLEWHMREMHRDRMVAGYFRFFKLRRTFISKRAGEVLEKDTLLLRMFCEAYGNINAQEEKEVPPLVDIYREKIFREYLERKIQSAAEYEEDSSRIRVRPAEKYEQALTHIIVWMIQRQQYANIPISEIPEEYDAALGALLGEDVIVRKDLAEADQGFGKRVEVINFTFDEFRDFLLAKYLATVVFRQDEHQFEKLVDRMVAPQSQVAEGVRSYLFFASRHPNGRDLIRVIREKEWYREIFIKSIFSVEQELITQDDLDEIKTRFHENERNASWIIRMLVWRWQSSMYAHLNIHLLFEILNELDQDAYDRLVRPSVSGRGVYGFDGAYSWNAEQLARKLQKDLDDEQLRETDDFCNMMELMIYLFPILGEWTFSSASFDTFEKYAQLKPNDAVRLLRKYTRITHVGIREQVWRMLTRIVKMTELPVELVEEACQFLLEHVENENPALDSLLREMVRFLETYAAEKAIWYTEAIVMQMKRHTLFPFFYEVIDDNRT